MEKLLMLIFCLIGIIACVVIWWTEYKIKETFKMIDILLNEKSKLNDDQKIIIYKKINGKNYYLGEVSSLFDFLMSKASSKDLKNMYALCGNVEFKLYDDVVNLEFFKR